MTRTARLRPRTQRSGLRRGRAVAASGRVGGRLCPDMTADSIVAGSPVSIQSPASSSPSTAVRVPGRGGASGASENVERFSRTARLLRSVADRAAGSASRTSPSAIAVSSSLVCATIVSAPLEISERCEASPPTIARRSKIHWKFRPGRPTSGSCITAASNHRLTVTIGRLASAVALAIVCSSPAGTSIEQRVKRVPRHGRNHERRLDHLVPHAHAANALAIDHQPWPER